jgi:ABC-type glycerol-3-phosphate transport system substrate-binding protein
MSRIRLFLIVAAVVLIGGCSAKQVDENMITVWHWMGDRQETFDNLSSQYENLTGTKVRFELYAPSGAYSQKIKAAAQTNTLPDIFGILGDARDFASFVKAGYVAEISSLMKPESFDSWQSSLFERALDVNRVRADNVYDAPSGLYGVPLDMTNVQFLYNKDLFRQAGLSPDEPPGTWGDFMRIAAQLRENDIPVLVSGFGEIWLIDILSTSLAMNIMGEAKVLETYRGNVPYTDPDWIKVLQTFKEMTDQDVFVTGTVTMVNKSAEQTFANSRAAMSWNGSWCVNVYKGMNPDLNYGTFVTPRINWNNPTKIWGGAGNSLMINNRSSRRMQAMEFLKWISEKDQQIFFANKTNNLPSNRLAAKNILPILSEFADDLDNTFHLNTLPVQEIPQVMEAWAKGIQSIMIREATPAQIAARVQKVKERELMRLGRVSQ